MCLKSAKIDDLLASLTVIFAGELLQHVARRNDHVSSGKPAGMPLGCWPWSRWGNLKCRGEKPKPCRRGRPVRLRRAAWTMAAKPATDWHCGTTTMLRR